MELELRALRAMYALATTYGDFGWNNRVKCVAKRTWRENRKGNSLRIMACRPGLMRQFWQCSPQALQVATCSSPLNDDLASLDLVRESVCVYVAKIKHRRTFKKIDPCTGAYMYIPRNPCTILAKRCDQCWAAGMVCATWNAVQCFALSSVSKKSFKKNPSLHPPLVRDDYIYAAIVRATWIYIYSTKHMSPPGLGQRLG